MSRAWFAGSSLKMGGAKNRTKGFIMPVRIGEDSVDGTASRLSSNLDTYNNQASADIRAITGAMKKTQASAAIDRDRALSLIQGAEGRSVGEFSNVPQDMITKEMQDAMYAEGRLTAEAERQSMLRNIQKSFGGGAMPSGAALEAAQGVDLAKMGTLAQLKRKIGTEAGEKNWASRFQRAGALSNIYTGTADRLSQVLGNTIAAVPELPGQVAPVNSVKLPPSVDL